MDVRGALAAVACLSVLVSADALADDQPLPGSRTVLLPNGMTIVIPPATIPCDETGRARVVWGAKFAARTPSAWKLQTAIYSDRNGARGRFHIEHQFPARKGRLQYFGWAGARCGTTYQLTARPAVAPGGPKLQKRLKRPRVFRFTVAQ